LIEGTLKTQIEDKANSLQEKLYMPDVPFLQKISAFVSLMGYYRFLNHSFFINAFGIFKEIISNLQKNSNLSELKKLSPPQVASLT
jgi:hypothetical protein